MSESKLQEFVRFASPLGGMLLLDKDMEWTSFDVVKKVRSLLHVKKVGHAGTLDPQATGLLILCSNQQTKLLDHFQALEKEYVGSCIFGATTSSYDAATEIVTSQSTDDLNEDVLQNAIQNFTGEIEQIPPLYSAVKVKGERLYKLARKGVEVAREARKVRVNEFSILSIDLPVMSFRIRCSKGTYVRSLVHDLGQTVGCGAYLQELRRTKIGSYDVVNAVTINQMQTIISEMQQSEYAGL